MLMRNSTQKSDPGLRGATSALALVRLALTSGDERLSLNPETGRNNYGVLPSVGHDGVWFASSTASPISPRGHAAATAAVARFVDAPSARVADWPHEIRHRIELAVGLAGSSVILAGSGTEAELIVAALAGHLFARPFTNVVLAPDETGSGVMAAAAGRHFLNSASCASSVERGALLSGIAPGSIVAEGIAIRAADGTAFSDDVVDDAVLAQAMRAVKGGRDVLVHCLATSKTGLSGLQRSTAAALRSTLGDRCLIVVDACQLRCSAEQIRRDLASGFLVVVSGSKFIAGPPFSAAILVPPDLRSRLGGLRLPAGLSAYSAVHDWPTPLRAGCESNDATSFNLPLYVRWEAALAELERYQSLDIVRRAAIIARFADAVEGLVARTAHLRLLPPPRSKDQRTIFPLMAIGSDGTFAAAKPIFRALTARGFHVGQPVAVGAADALRICLSAPQICDVADRQDAGASLDVAMRPLLRDLNALAAALATMPASRDATMPR